MARGGFHPSDTLGSPTPAFPGDWHDPFGRNSVEILRTRPPLPRSAQRQLGTSRCYSPPPSPISPSARAEDPGHAVLPDDVAAQSSMCLPQDESIPAGGALGLTYRVFGVQVCNPPICTVSVHGACGRSPTYSAQREHLLLGDYWGC